MQRSQHGVSVQTEIIIHQSSTKSAGQIHSQSQEARMPSQVSKGRVLLCFLFETLLNIIQIFWAHFEHSITFARSFLHQTCSSRCHLPFIACLLYAGRSLSAFSHLLVLLAVACRPLLPPHT